MYFVVVQSPCHHPSHTHHLQAPAWAYITSHCGVLCTLVHGAEKTNGQQDR